MSESKQETQRHEPGSMVYWRLFGIALDPEQGTPCLYGVLREAAIDTPLLVEGRLALFVDPQHAVHVLRRYADVGAEDRIDVDEVFVICDVAQALYLLSAGGSDSEAALLNAVNVLLDLVAATGISMDARRRDALGDIADFCTTRSDVSTYLEEEGRYSSQELVDAVLWCVGAIVVKSVIVSR